MLRAFFRVLVFGLVVLSGLVLYSRFRDTAAPRPLKELKEDSTRTGRSPNPARATSQDSADRVRGAEGIGLPIAGLRERDLRDTFNEGRGEERKHEAVDIIAPRGTPVNAMVTGRIARLFTSKPGGLTIYQFDESGELCYYYAHLDRYAAGLEEGAVVTRGTTVGYVGTTGNAPPDTPHLHLAIFRLGPAKRWWEGTPINPYPMLKEMVR